MLTPPTNLLQNHLDMETIDALIIALRDFKGGVLVVSHDQHLLTQVVNDFYVVGDKQVTKVRGDFTTYKKSVLKNVPGA